MEVNRQEAESWQVLIKSVRWITALVLAAGLMSACGEKLDPCQINPTRQAADGTWVEHDGEELDSDPCDSDDFEVKVNKTPTKKPATKSTKKP